MTYCGEITHFSSFPLQFLQVKDNLTRLTTFTSYSTRVSMRGVQRGLLLPMRSLAFVAKQ